MKKLNMYKVSFVGRKINAIGIIYRINDILIAENKEQLNIEIYKKYENILGSIEIEIIN